MGEKGLGGVLRPTGSSCNTATDCLTGNCNFTSSICIPGKGQRWLFVQDTIRNV